MVLNLIFLGPPGAGKGLVSQKIEEDLKLKQVSTGQLIRDEISAGSELGEKVKSVVESGALVSDELVGELLKSKLGSVYESGVNGVIFDGFPRTLAQAPMLENILKELGEELSAVIYISTSEEETIKRLSSRRTCEKCGKIYNLVSAPPKIEGKCDVDGGELLLRKDDNPETIKGRLLEYKEKTAPLINYFKDKGLLKEYDGNCPPEESVNRAKKIIEEINN
jgi:adenylate kinase